MLKHYTNDAILAGIMFDNDSGVGGGTSDSSQPSSDASQQSDSSSDASSDSGSAESSTPSLEETQGLVAISDEELMGIPEEKDDDASAKDDDSDSSSQDKADDKDKKDDESAAEKKAGPSDSKADEDAGSKDDTDDKSDDDDKSGDDKSDKPPKGFVPTQALHEVRGENKYLKGQIAELQKQIAAKPAGEEKPAVEELKKPEPDFDILDKTAFDKLTEDDPAGALKYMQKLNDHKDALRDYDQAVERQERQQAEAEMTQQELTNLFHTTNSMMEEHVPGLFGEDGEVQKELANFAETLGFTDDMFYLTNPETRILLPGESEPLYLGEQAASVIKVLASARTAISENKADEVDVDKLTEEITAKVRKEVEAELVEKFKNKDTPEFRSLNEVPDSEGGPEFQQKVLSDEEYAKLSPKEQEAYLAGA